MADVTLFFAPFPGENAIGLQVEESENGVDGWAQIIDTDEIGTYPNWVTSYVVQATSINYYFRIRWQLDQPDSGGPLLFTEWSDPVRGSDLPYHWTVPDLYRSVTQHNLGTWTNPQLQMLIDRAYYLIQSHCGPFTETEEGFADIAQLVIHSVMDRMQPALSQAGLGMFSGMEAETMGSYSYRRKVEATIELVAGAFTIPYDLTALICPFGEGRADLVDVSTTQVFYETEHYLAGTEGKIKVFTTADRTRDTVEASPWPWFRNWGPD